MVRTPIAPPTQQRVGADIESMGDAQRLIWEFANSQDEHDPFGPVGSLWLDYTGNTALLSNNADPATAALWVEFAEYRMTVDGPARSNVDCWTTQWIGKSALTTSIDHHGPYCGIRNWDPGLASEDDLQLSCMLRMSQTGEVQLG